MIPRFCSGFDKKEIKMLFKNGNNIIEIFEKKFSRSVESKYAVSFPSGRAAFYAIIKSLNVLNSEIILPSYSCVAVPIVILETNNIPIFADISLRDYNMKIDETINQISEKTRAIIPTYMYGYPWDTKKLKEQINEDIILIEDAALAPTTRDVGKYGDVQFYSFGFYKPIYTCEGGMVTTNNDELYEKIKTFRDYNYNNESFSVNLKKIFSIIFSCMIYKNFIYNIHNIRNENFIKKFYSEHLDIYDKHLTKEFFQIFSKFQAKIGIAQINKLNENITNRKLIASYYNKALENIENIILPPLIEGATFSEYTIRINNRNKFIKYMEKKGIQVNALFRYSLPHLPSLKNYGGDEYKNSLIASQQVVNLPIYPRLINNPDALNNIVDTIYKYLK